MIDVLDEQKKDGPEGDEGGTTKDVDGEAAGGVQQAFKMVQKTVLRMAQATL